MITACSHKKIFLLALTAFVLNSCYKEIPLEEPGPWKISGRVLELDGVFACTDLKEGLLLYTIPGDTIQNFSPRVRFGDYQSVELDGRVLKENEKNDLGKVIVNHPYVVKARNGKETASFMLYFTNLPLLHIHTEGQIPDEPKLLSWMELACTEYKDGVLETTLFSGYAGIEIRGRTSAAHEKKSYGLELWKDRYGNDDTAPLLGMRSGEDWILDAMYVDPLRMRNRLSFEIWEKMWVSQLATPFQTLKPGIQCEYVELFIKQRYMGLYCLSEKLDESLINLGTMPTGTDGALYKAIDWTGGSTAFTSYNSPPPQSMIWEGWEQVYPDKRFYWDPLAELRAAVVFDEDGIFSQRIDTLLNLEAAAEYYLFTNLILAHDNIIKNYFLLRYPNESEFLMLPWDLEASWGIMWHGGESSSNGVLKNNLYNRLIELDVKEFNELVKDRWEYYRESIFQLDSIKAPVLRYSDLLVRSGAIERENSRWENVDIDMNLQINYFTQWLTLRLAYLDQVFD